MRRPSRFIAIVFIALGAAAAAACDLTLTSPSASVAFSQNDLKVGSGTAAVVGNTLGVKYTGWLYDPSRPDQKGAQFDASGDTPFSFILGTGQVIAGWDKGVAGMQVGGVRRLVIPPSLAYGDSRHGIIPPNATLVFDIELATLQ